MASFLLQRKQKLSEWTARPTQCLHLFALSLQHHPGRMCSMVCTQLLESARQNPPSGPCTHSLSGAPRCLHRTCLQLYPQSLQSSPSFISPHCTITIPYTVYIAITYFVYCYILPLSCAVREDKSWTILFLLYCQCKEHYLAHN